MPPLQCNCPLTQPDPGGTIQLNRSNTMKTNLMKKTLTALALASLGLVATGAQADGNRGGFVYGHQGHDGHAYKQSRMFSQQINARQDQQLKRIKAGMRSGALTRGEFRELMHEQREIRSMERHFKADGFLDTHEFRRLDRALDLASRNIMEEKHDRQTRNTYGHNPRFN
jgi:hypothetical protein